MSFYKYGDDDNRLLNANSISAMVCDEKHCTVIGAAARPVMIEKHNSCQEYALMNRIFDEESKNAK